MFHSLNPVLYATALALSVTALGTGCNENNSVKASQSQVGKKPTVKPIVETTMIESTSNSGAQPDVLVEDGNWDTFKQRIEKYKDFNKGNENHEE